MAQKTVEFYMQTLKEYTTKLKKDKVVVLMQVGEFFEIYGLVYPDGSREGVVWEFCDNTNLKIALKPQTVYDRPEIQVYMGGVGESYVNPYIQKAVDRFGWTVVIFDQHKIGNTNKFERKESAIISPGININSDNFSNITLFIYMENVKQYYSKPTFTSSTLAGKRNNDSQDSQIHIGVAYIDCLTGENGIMAMNNAPSSDISIQLDELLKILTIKNPNEMYIYLENIDPTMIPDDDLVNALHLFNYRYKIIRDTIPENNYKLKYQQTILESVYLKQRGLMDIMQQLNIDGPEHNYSRIALTLLIEFIMKHDKTVIQKLETPEIILNSDKYMMLANNALEQLDIIDNYKQEYRTNNRRVSLLELLDNTRTPLGKILLRQRLSIPITDETLLAKRYNQIHELQTLHTQYLAKNVGNGGSADKYGSPLHQLRMKLANIKNIENYLRKIITSKIQPGEIAPYIESLEACITVFDYVKTIATGTGTSNITPSIQALLPSSMTVTNFKTIYEQLLRDLKVEFLNCNVWNGITSNPLKRGISTVLDNLQAEIDNDQNFLDTLLDKLSKIIDPNYYSKATNVKQLIYVGENATKGIHIFTNTSRKELLEKYFNEKGAKMQVGTYILTSKDFTFLKMKESKWEIEIPLLKSSNGTLKVNIDRMGKLAKTEMMIWFKANITEQSEILEALNTYARFIAEIDVLQSNVLNVVDKGYTKPLLNTSLERKTSYLNIEQIRHPIIESINTKTQYVPNDIAMGVNNKDGVLLFGVNAVGKSSLMKSIGVNLIMAQAGMYVAASKFEYKPFKYLFTRILGNDNLYAGLSSFEVEMKEFKVILKFADENSIILGDELCRGTVIEDSSALVAAALEMLSKRGSKFIFATHIHSLTGMDCVTKLENIRLCHMLVEQDPNNAKKLIYSRKLKDGSGPSSYGILVASSMNIDEDFIARAIEIRKGIESQTHSSGSNVIVGSKYNKDKVIAMCEVCCKNNAVDVHHINQQCDANCCELIDNIELGIFNKNKLWNLVSLCKPCHQAVHASPSKLSIKGYETTTNGLELNYSWLRTSSTSSLKNTNSSNGSDSEYPDVTGSNDESVTPARDVPRVSVMTEEIKNKILEMKGNNATPKKIQFDIKRYFNYTISQQAIRVM